MNILRIGTRKSQLALWQAEYVRAALLARQPELTVELVPMTTQGDRIQDRTLLAVGGKGLFTKELEQALLQNRVDLAVHSLKDVTVDMPDGLDIPVICERADPRDAFVSNRFEELRALPPGGRVGTASLRRQAQLRHHYPHLQILDLRGNVNTRLAKLDDGEFDAIILAAAGLKRLGFAARIRAYLDPNESLPAVGQGAICLQTRADDSATLARIAPLNHIATQLCIRAERALNAHLQGGCALPIGGFAELEGDRMHVRGLVGSRDGRTLLRAEMRGAATQAERLGISVASDLLEQGARDLLDGARDHGAGERAR